MRLALKTGQRLMKKKKKVAADRVTRLKPRRNIYKTLLLNFAGVGFSLEQSARKSGFFLHLSTLLYLCLLFVCPNYQIKNVVSGNQRPVF
jgi:hypothetical protein